MKPVAYGRYIENAKMWLVVELDADMPKGYIPLYTHPKGFNWSDVNNEQLMNEVRSRGYIISNAQVSAHPVKELTEEMAKDLANLYIKQYGEPFPAVSYAMAIHKYLIGQLDLLAILRKAQEK